MLRVILVAGLVAAAAAFVPGQPDQCNLQNINGGSYLLPHEKYCQLFYSCDIDGNRYVTKCPLQSLFAYGVGTQTCASFGVSPYLCPKWACSSGDIGRRYPDVCCDKYWECTSSGQLSERQCGIGSTFDSVNEICSVNSGCSNDDFCVDNVQPSGFNNCHNSPSSNGDPCKYRSEGWNEDRLCPVGTSYNQATCQCSDFNQGCSISGLTGDQLQENKKPDSQCRASGRMEFTTNQLRVVSDKLGRDVDHYFYRTGGFNVNGQEAVFSTTNNVVPFIYDFFYNDNTLYAPLAIVMTVRFDVNNINLNSQYSLLENRWTTDPSNTHCSPVTLQISATYTGVSGGSRNWRFDFGATGENGVDSQASASIQGTSSDYFRVLFTFNGVLGGSVTNRGQSGAISGQTSTMSGDNRQLGSALRPNKCGFALGRGFTGRMREFAVHEGCQVFNVLG